MPSLPTRLLTAAVRGGAALVAMSVLAACVPDVSHVDPQMPTSTAASVPPAPPAPPPPPPPAGPPPSQTCSGLDFFVNPGGDDTNPGTLALPFQTITHAAAVAGAGNTVNVSPGTYNAISGEIFPIFIPTGVCLLGDVGTRGSTTIISGGGLVSGSLDSTLDPQSLTSVAGFTLTNPNPGGVAALGLLNFNVTVFSSTVTGPSSSGIYIMGGGGHSIFANTITGANIGLIFRPPFTGQYSLVQGNQITNNGYAVEFDDFGGDLGGGATSSAGGNTLSCNAINDIWTNQIGTIYAVNNLWDHVPPTQDTANAGAGIDIQNFGGGVTFVTTAAATVATPCP